jgi:triphosphoribosyl-dephospho-CoA synthetase
LIKYLKASIAAIMILFITTASFASPVFADQQSAQTAISSAKNTIKGCYDAVKESEAAGANVDSLMGALNDAAGLLSKAELAYASNDYDSAYSYATQSKSKLNGFISQAVALKETAINNDNQNFTIIVLSIIGSVAILCVGTIAWIVLNRKNRKNLNGPPTV